MAHKKLNNRSESSRVSDVQETSPEQAIAIFLFWFRFATIALVAFISLTGIKAVPVLPFWLAITYNIVILVFRSSVIGKLRSHPTLLLMDILISFLLIAGSGGYKSPYYLYSFSPLVVGSFLFGYKGAFLLAGVQSILFSIAVSLRGFGLVNIAASDQSAVTDFFFFFLTAVSVAYLADLLNELDKANQGKAVVESELEEVRRQLELSLQVNQLSEREAQVLILTSEGKTVEQCARELGLSKNTIKTYLRRSCKKLDVSTKQKAVSKVLIGESTLD